MSLRLEMLQVARLSPTLLGDSAPLVADFLKSQLNADGGFRDRDGVSDLYYTVFGMEGLIALRADVPHAAIADYLGTITDVESLDLVHVCCLARCWANLPTALRSEAPIEAILRRIESFRSRDGGFNTIRNNARGTVYGCFLATAGYADAGSQVPRPHELLRSVESLKAADGGYANQRELPVGLTPSSAAAATLLRYLDQRNDSSLAAWLLARCRPEGGFLATPMAPMPDLLSTATALHALAGMQADLSAIKEPCLDFVDSLWTASGSFYGNWGDDMIDTEYTYYGLLALGHLSL